jgi:hypothetical protein
MPARVLLAEVAATLSPNETVTAVTFAAVLELFTLLVALCAAGQATNFMRMTPLVRTASKSGARLRLGTAPPPAEGRRR